MTPLKTGSISQVHRNDPMLASVTLVGPPKVLAPFGSATISTRIRVAVPYAAIARMGSRS